MSEFLECFARIDRARNHAQAAADLWNRMFTDNPCTFALEVEDEGVAVTRAVFSKPIGNGLHIALEIGELFYQLRAALDGAVFRYAEPFLSAYPSANPEHLYFPVCTKTRTFKKSTFYALPFPQELKDWVESIQPCNAKYLIDRKQKEIAALLVHINTLAKGDRHRSLHVVAAMPSDIGGHITLYHPGEITFTEAVPCNFLIGETVFLRFGFEANGTDKLHVNAHFVPEIRVEEIPFTPPWRLLSGALTGSRYIVERLEMVQAGNRLVL